MLSDLTDHLEADLPAILAPGGRAVLERSAAAAAPEPELELLVDRTYGGSAISVWQRG